MLHFLSLLSYAIASNIISNIINNRAFILALPLSSLVMVVIVTCDDGNDIDSDSSSNDGSCMCVRVHGSISVIKWLAAKKNGDLEQEGP